MESICCSCHHVLEYTGPKDYTFCPKCGARLYMPCPVCGKTDVHVEQSRCPNPKCNALFVRCPQCHMLHSVDRERCENGCQPGLLESFYADFCASRVNLARTGSQTRSPLIPVLPQWPSSSGDTLNTGYRMISAPISYAGQLIMGTDDGRVTAYDEATGRLLWRGDRDHGGDLTDIELITWREFVLFSRGDVVTALLAATGTSAWELVPGLRDCAAICTAGTLFVHGWDRAGNERLRGWPVAALTALGAAPPPSIDHKLSDEPRRGDRRVLAASSQHAYVATEEQFVQRCSADGSLEMVWGNPEGLLTTQPVVADNHLYLLGQRGDISKLIQVDLRSDGFTTSSVELRLRPTPLQLSVIDSSVYLAVAGGFVCYDASDIEREPTRISFPQTLETRDFVLARQGRSICIVYRVYDGQTETTRVRLVEDSGREVVLRQSHHGMRPDMVASNGNVYVAERARGTLCAYDLTRLLEEPGR